MRVLFDVNSIDKVDWEHLIQNSSTATWFQTREAYDFFSSFSFYETFVVGVERNGVLRGLIVGYIQKDGGRLKQFFSRRAIIIGGPVLANDITDEELKALLTSLTAKLRHKTIYIETRNSNDYSRWRNIFEECGFAYQPHLNFHLNTQSLEQAQSRIGKHRWRYIRISIRDGAKLVDNPSLSQVHDFYDILSDLYKTKVKRPLFPFELLEKLYALKSVRFFLVEYDDKIIGGTVCMLLEGHALYEWMKCGNEHLYKNIRPSSVATWFGIKYAAENGCKIYDFMGAGKPNEAYGVRDFKAEFGGELVEHGRFIHVCNKILYSLGTIAVKMIKR